MADRDEIIKAEVAAGRSQRQIANLLGVSLQTVRRCMKKLGLVGRSIGTRATEPNHDVFDVIDSEVKAYWFGMFLAEGCLAISAGTRRAIRISLRNQDFDHLQRLGTFFGYTGQYHLDERDGHPRRSIVFNSVHIGQVLLNIGWESYRESGDPSILSSVPDSLFNHFVRGYFDGDGCISRRKRSDKSWYIRISDNKDRPRGLEAMERRIAAVVNLPVKGVKTRSNYVSIGWNGRRQVHAFGNWLYAGATVWMARKRERFRLLGNELGRFDFSQVTVREVEAIEYVPFFDAYHYMGCGGRRGTVLGCYIGTKLVAAAMIGGITRAEMARKQGVLTSEARELARFCVHPDHHVKNLPTWLMGRLLKAVRAWVPDVKLLISFADTTQGHEGTIYKASNWIDDGLTGRSYHYVDGAGRVIHKKTVYGAARRAGLTERQYRERNNLTKVLHQPKKRFLFWLKK